MPFPLLMLPLHCDSLSLASRSVLLFSIQGWMRRVLILGVVVIFFAPLLRAYDVALRNGSVVHFEKYRVVNKELLYTSASGEERSVLLSDINFARTRELNEKENPPLDLSGWITRMDAPKKSPPTPPPPPTPLGDVARQLLLKGEVDPDRRVFTNDDFPSSPIPPSPVNATSSPSSDASPKTPSSSSANAPSASSDWASSKAKIELFLKKTEGLNERQYAARSLGPDLADVQFPKRSSWQAELYADHRKYVADAKLCISDRVSDEGRHQDASCSRLDSDKSAVQSLRAKGQALAQDWKSRQDAFVPH